MVVEDNQVNMQIISKVLKKIGSPATHCFSSGHAAIQAYTDRLAEGMQLPYDLIFMDISLPDITGLEAAKLIRMQSTSQPYIVAFTANCMVEDVREYLSNGMDALLPKPFQQRDLISVMEQFVLKTGRVLSP